MRIITVSKGLRKVNPNIFSDVKYTIGLLKSLFCSWSSVTEFQGSIHRGHQSKVGVEVKSKISLHDTEIPEINETPRCQHF